MRLAPVLGLTAALSAAGCGGNTTRAARQQPGGAAGSGAAGRGGTGTSTGSGGTGGGDFALTSYDLRFVDVTSDSPAGFESPSLGSLMRIDFHEEPANLYAVVTPRWSTPVTYTVGIGLGIVTLDVGYARILGSRVFEEWRRIVIHRELGGELGSRVELSGSRRVVQAGAPSDHTVDAIGVLSIDSTPPELDTEQRSLHGPVDRLLPWDPIVLRAAEGVDASELAARLEIGLDGGAPPLISWREEPAGEQLTRSGLAKASGLLQGWFHRSVTGTLAVAAGVPDRVGLLAPAAKSNVTVIGFEAVSGQQRFDGAGPEGASWGTVERLSAGAGAPCESDGCALLGPFDDGLCPAERAGVAGRVITSGPSIAVRYRVLVGPGLADPTNPAPVTLRFTVEAARPGEDADSHLVTVHRASLEPLPAPSGKLRWSTPWTTYDMPTRSAGDTGFAVSVEPCPEFDLGAEPAVPMAILVDSVSG